MQSPSSPFPRLSSAPHSKRKAAAIVVIFALCAASWWPALTFLAQEQVDAGLHRALVTFGAARALNAALSVLQGTEVSLQPLGFGVTLTLGQVLEPVNRVVEQFSTVMLYATVAFGIERVLVAVGAWWPVCAALTALSIAWAAATVRGGAPAWLSRALLLALLVRFAVPLAVLGSDGLFKVFLQEPYATSQRVLEATPARVQDLAPGDPAAARGGLLDRLKEAAAAPVREVRQRYEGIQVAAEQAVERMIQLIVVFVLQTALLPLLLLWVFWRVARTLVEPSARAR